MPLQKHLIPQLLEEHGLTNGHLSFPQPILHHITRGYTREVGVGLVSLLARSCPPRVAGSHVCLNVSVNALESLKKSEPQYAREISWV